MTGHRRHRPNRWLVGLGNLVGVLVIFFTLPIGDHDGRPVRLAVNVLLSVAAIVLVAYVVARETSSGIGRPQSRNGLQLILLLEIAVAAFALCYYAVAINVDQEFDGLSTRIDALYFTMSTMTTVGFGDIHAEGQLARGVVTVNMAFNLGFIAALGGLVRRRVQATDRDSDTPTGGPAA